MVHSWRVVVMWKAAVPMSTGPIHRASEAGEIQPSNSNRRYGDESVNDVGTSPFPPMSTGPMHRQSESPRFDQATQIDATAMRVLIMSEVRRVRHVYQVGSSPSLTSDIRTTREIGMNREM
jgi:hypothetical protein